MGVSVKHHHQTAKSNDPSKDVSATAWNEEHDITGLIQPLTGTAAWFAANNPVLLLGQLGYETDTLSIKIGDGTTAYNSLTYVYRGLPVAGEPSTGTLHHHPLSNTTGRAVVNGAATPAVGTWSAALSCAAYGFAGEKAVLADIILDVTATAASRALLDIAFSDNNTTTPSYVTAHPYITHDIEPAIAGTRYRINKEIVIPLNANREFYVYCANRIGVTAGVIYVILKGNMG